jgi:hypothetical protein
MWKRPGAKSQVRQGFLWYEEMHEYWVSKLLYHERDKSLSSLGMIVSKEDWNSSMSQAVVEAAHIINKVRIVLAGNM